MPQNDQLARVALIGSMQNEMLVAMEFIRRGLALQADTEYTLTQKFFVMYDLAQGLERYLKLALTFVILSNEQRLPTRREIQGQGPGNGHSVQRLLKDLVGHGNHPGLQSTAEGRWCLDYLGEDVVFRRVVEQLDRFGTKDRYYDLDVLGGQPRADSSPSELWEELETAIGKNLYPDANQWYEMAVRHAEQYDTEVYGVLIDHLKWGLYAVTKIMISGRQGDPTLGWPQHFLDYLFAFGPPARLYSPYHG